MLRYLHHDKPVEETGLAADLTVLDYLRDHKNYCGTKEGCASGDCGACTVVVAEVVSKPGDEDSLVYRAVNSCITFAATLHGKQLITVENLQDEKNFHPSQQCMVDCHGSQCGFCTPGIVMSIFAAMKNIGSLKPDRELINEKLGGNLCRCTGYRPIVSAAEQALAKAVEPDQFSRRTASTIDSLNKINSASEQTVDVFHQPESINELCQLLAKKPDAVMLGGGTDLALSVTQNLESIQEILFLGNMKELDFFSVEKSQIRVGAGLTLAAFRDSIISLCPQLETLLVRFGGTQVRNQATVGGNFANASPVGDLPPVFIALNASMVLQSERGCRTLSAEEFFISYKNTQLAADEFIREFVIPLESFDTEDPARQVVNRFYKISKRMEDDISAVCAAFHLLMDGEKIIQVSTGFGGLAEIPKRALTLESVLTGNILDEKCLEMAANALRKDFNPIGDVRASADYRVRVTENLLIRLATELYSPEAEVLVPDHEC